jgi:hypothetical protein
MKQPSIEQIRDLAAEVTTLPAPAGAWERIAARLESGESVILPGAEHLAAPAEAPLLRRGRTALRAALLVLGFAGFASAMVPGSPVRAWIGRVLPFAATGAGTGPAARGVAAPGVEPGADGSAATPAAQLLVPLVDGALAIRIERPDPELRIRVRVSGEPDVLVHASGGAAGGRFRTAVGRLTIEEAGGGDVVIGVPAGAGRVSLEVDGQLFLLQEAGRLQVLVPVADTVGSEFVFSPRHGGAPGRP